MSEENMSDSYEVGYGKPPKGTQFKKGSSGNPKGRPRKARDFHHELLRQSRASITLNVNGSRRRVSKHEAAILQLLDKSIRGNIPALRVYFGQYQVAFEKEALLEAAQAGEVERRKDILRLTDEELAQLIFEEEKKEEEQKKKEEEQKKKKLPNSNAD